MELWRAFPILYNIAANKEGMINSFLHFEEGNPVSSPTFRRNFQDQEVESFVQFLGKLYSQRIDGKLATGKIGCYGREERASNSL